MLGAAFVCAGSARAATKVWAGGSNSTWSTAANWVGSSAPTSSDTAAFKGWIPLVSSGWTVTASNTYMTFAASNTKDNTLDTFWMTGANQASGMYVIINLGSAQTFSGIDIDSSPAYPNDYPRGFDIYVSSNGSTWGSPIASGTGSDHFTSVTFDEQTYQYIKIQLDTSYGSAWWTIAELTVWNTADSVGTKLSRTGWTLTAHNTDGASPLANAIDSDPATRWANGAAQLSGHWFKVDLGTTTSVTGILLDAYDDVDDYLRQYTLADSTDNTNWTNIPSSVSNTKAYLLHTFSAVNARYLRVTLTTGSGGPWWCIGDVQVFGTPNTANIAADTTIAALELSKGVTITQAAGADLTVTGSFTASAGTFTGSTGTVTIGGSMTISGATFTGGSGNVYVAGDFTFSSGTFTAPSGLLQVTGAFSRTNGTFTHNSGRVLLSSSSSKTFATGGVTFNSVYVNDGLVGYWNLDEGAGSSIADSSGWGHTGTLYNTPTWAAGPTTPSFTNASSMVVNGTTQYARISRTTALEPTAVSVSVWVKRNGAQTQYGKVLGKVYANNASTIPYATYALQMNQNNTDSGLITFHTGHTAGAQSALNSTAGAIADGVWTHVLATYDPAGSAPQKKLYINGVLNASATITTALLYDSTSNGDL
ncbi:MAG TPA: discoidin domain-containing protein, partial [Polyangia bacterium]